MNQMVQKYLSQLKAYYTNLNKQQKRNMWLIGIIFLATVVILVVFFMKPNYQVVFYNLDAKSAGQITAQLDQQKVPYQLQGNNILIPASMADKVRLEMAMAGLPSTGNIDYSSIFQQNSLFGMTSQELNLQVLNVLEQRLAQTISSINGIEGAQVNIVMPQQQSFLIQQNSANAKASVLLSIAPGYVLSSQQVSGIQQLVAHSVQGLNASNVSVVDQNGNDLTNNAGNANSVSGSLSGQLTNQLSVQSAVEQNLASQIKSSLANIVGASNVAVVVHANVSIISVSQQKHQVTSGVILSNQSSSSTTGASGTGGVAGQATQNPNLPNYAATGTGTGTGSSSKNSTTNYDNNYTNTTTQFDPLQISGYTVSVLINSNAITMTPKLLSSIRSYVQTSIGQVGTAKAANITIMSQPFATTNLTVPVAPWYTSPLVLAGLGILVVGGVLVWLVLRSRSQRARVTSQGIESLSVASLSNPVPESQESIVSNELKELASRRPDAFASLVRTWLSED